MRASCNIANCGSVSANKGANTRPKMLAKLTSTVLLPQEIQSIISIWVGRGTGAVNVTSRAIADCDGVPLRA
jgi:hypothetical protein